MCFNRFCKLPSLKGFANALHGIVAAHFSVLALPCVFLSICHVSTADEIQYIKDGKNNYPVLERVSASATIRWGLSATPYNNRWQDMHNMFAWVTMDSKYEKCTDESEILSLVEPKDAENNLLPFEWYYKAAVPKDQLGYIAHIHLVVLPFQMPCEAALSTSDLCKYPDQKHSLRLANGRYKHISTANVQAPKSQKGDPVHDDIEDWVKANLVPAMADAGVLRGGGG
jgi:hypothetical protein